MANKQRLTPEEWTKILESTMLAGMAKTAAELAYGWRTRRRPLWVMSVHSTQ